MSNYRAIGYNSSVDESLFGNSNDKNSSLHGKKTRTKFVATGPLPPSSVVISVDELNKILVSSYYSYLLLLYLIIYIYNIILCYIV